jgi:hypothetical protein
MLKPGDKATSISYLFAVLSQQDTDHHQGLSVMSKAECTTRIVTFLERNMTLLESLRMTLTVRIARMVR